MKKINQRFFVILCLIFGTLTQVFSRVEIIQRRHVARENINEFIERENTYWSEVARKAIEEDKLIGWSLWQRVDGLNLDTTHNFIFINSFEEPADLDHSSDIWNVNTVFPNKRMR